MKAQDLKNSILQLAMQGKIVPQNQKDEPAFILLENIKQKKKDLIKAKIKKNNKESVIYFDQGHYYEKVDNKEPICIDSEIPFDIPDSWEWCRFGCIVDFSLGKTPPRKDPKFWDDAAIPWVSISDMIDGGIVSITKENVNDYALNNSFKGVLVPKNTLLMSFKLTVGKVSILGIDAVHNEAIISINPYVDKDNGCRDYLFYVLPLISNTGNTKSAIKGKTLNSKSLYNLLVPLPPIDEQKRISEKLKIFLPLIDDYGVNEEQLTRLNSEFPAKLKSSILQEAVQGKLVHQDSNDEPASVLLDKIKQEKQQLIKAKIKKNNKESFIYKEDGHYYEKLGKKGKIVCIDDEIPFDIPDSWEWCRINTIREVYTGNSINKTEKETKYSGLNEGYNYIATKDVNFNCFIDYNNGIKIPKGLDKFRIAPSGSILLCIEGGSAGRKIGILNEDVCFGNKLACFKAFIGNNKFLFYYLQSPNFKDIFKSKTTGIIGGVGIAKLRNVLMPIPPLNEQKRIVDKIEQLFENVDVLIDE